ncbi:MAG: selenocysteine-specific translation elongation factor [Gemmatimonadales bacterium]
MIIGTAGHVDHGKSALVEALTGHRMDRLAEERRRGITIDLNFAPYPLPDGSVAGFIDVPGHEDFVQTMVAGSSGVDLVLLVVAADEGIMPQTREHLSIVEQLGIPRGIVVLTKTDLVDSEWLALLEAEVGEWVAASSVVFDAPLPVSALTGTGLPALRAAIVAQAAHTRPRDPGDLFRMPVDRAFSVPGVGTVITGTAWSGSVTVGEAIRLLPDGREGRIRSIETFGAAVERSQPGARTAIGLAGVDRAAVRRGDLAVSPDAPWVSSRALDVRLESLADMSDRLAERTRVRVSLGTTEVMARLHLRPGAGGQAWALARLALESPVVARGGDRFVLRSFSPVTTIGGGTILDPVPPRRGAAWPASLGALQPGERLAALVARRREGARVADLPVLLGTSDSATAALVDRGAGLTNIGGRLVPASMMRDLERAALEQVEEWHRLHPADPGAPIETIRKTLSRTGGLAMAAIEAQVAKGSLVRREALLIRSGWSASGGASTEEIERLVLMLEAAGLTPPSLAELEASSGKADLRTMLKPPVAEGRLVAVAPDRYFAAGPINEFVAALQAVGTGGAITPTVLRDRLGLSRKFLIPLLEWADRRGLTRRNGESRVLVKRS